jgi:signal peptidase I
VKLRGFSKILILVVLVVAAGVVAAYLILFRQKGYYMPESLEEVKCVYPVGVQGDSMEPAIKSGSTLSLNKCIEDRESLSSGQVVLFEEKGVKRIGRIKERVKLEEGVFYKIGRDARPGEEFSVSSGDILAIETP